MKIPLPKQYPIVHLFLFWSWLKLQGRLLLANMVIDHVVYTWHWASQQKISTETSNQISGQLARCWITAKPTFCHMRGPTTKQWFHVFSSAMTTVSLKLSMPGISGGSKFYQPRVDGYVGVPENWVYIGIIQKVSQGKYHDEAANLQLPRSPTNSYV